MQKGCASRDNLVSRDIFVKFKSLVLCTKFESCDNLVSCDNLEWKVYVVWLCRWCATSCCVVLCEKFTCPNVVWHACDLRHVCAVQQPLCRATRV
jgi:hypothetical protein